MRARLVLALLAMWLGLAPVRQVTEDELDALAFDEGLLPFAERVIPQLFPDLKVLPAHWLEILAQLDGCLGGRRLVINMPPRHGKTVCGLVCMAWIMKRWPRLRNAYATYGQDFSETQARTIMRPLLQAAGVELATDNADVFETPERGALYITSRDSPLLGKGVSGLLLIDDPYKNDKEAISAQIQETVWDWWQGTARSRLEGPASVVIMHQRWNFDDMTGRLDEAGSNWDKLVVPAISPSGDALWPAIKSLAELRSIERERPEVFAAMYQQEPIARGTTMFREPARYDLEEWLRTLDPMAWRWCIAVDPAATAKTSADHSAALLCAYRGAGDNMEGYAIDLLHEQVEVPDLVDDVVELRRKWMSRHRITALPIVCESVGLGAGIPQAMRKLAPADQVIGVPAKGDKFTRALGVSAAWNAGRFKVPTVKSGEKWAAYVREHRRFTGQPGGKDDQVDTTAHGWNFEFRRRPELVRGIRKIELHGLG